jgi:hypothetical protein
VSCPSEALPAGWRAWRGSVPPELGQFAVDVLRRISGYPYGAVAEIIDWQRSQVAAFKSHHTWTYRRGQLVTGVCIPGISLLVPQNAAFGLGAADDLTNPDPNLAIYTVDQAPPLKTDWALVGVTAVAIVGVSTALALGLRLAGRR